MNKKTILILWAFLCAFIPDKGHFTTEEIEGDWKDISTAPESWNILCLYNHVGDIQDSTYKLVNDTFYAYNLKDYRYPGRGGTWTPTNVVVRHTPDSLVFYAYHFNKYHHLYNFAKGLDNNAPGFDKVSLSGNAWYADYPTVKIEIDKDGAVFLSGADYRQKVHNFTYQLTPKTVDFFQRQFKELEIDTMSPRYECNCPFAWKDTLYFEYNGKRKAIYIKGTEQTPPMLQIFLTSVMSLYKKIPMVRVKEQHEFVDFSKGDYVGKGGK